MNRIQQRFISDAHAHLDELEPFEQEFIVNLHSKPATYELSSRQNHILNRINTKVGGLTPHSGWGKV